jgi:hypothetical protein
MVVAEPFRIIGWQVLPMKFGVSPEANLFVRSTIPSQRVMISFRSGISDQIDDYGKRSEVEDRHWKDLEDTLAKNTLALTLATAAHVDVSGSPPLTEDDLKRVRTGERVVYFMAIVQSEDKTYRAEACIYADEKAPNDYTYCIGHNGATRRDRH